jgi:hypothetical protein
MAVPPPLPEQPPDTMPAQDSHGAAAATGQPEIAIVQGELLDLPERGPFWSFDSMGIVIDSHVPAKNI